MPRVWVASYSVCDATAVVTFVVLEGYFTCSFAFYLGFLVLFLDLLDLATQSSCTTAIFTRVDVSGCLVLKVVQKI